MKKLFIPFFLFSLSLTMSHAMDNKDSVNPFFQAYNTPHETFPFDRIKNEHYEPAIREGIKRNMAEIDAIVNNPEKPNFKNTILALDNSGMLLTQVASVFSNLMGAETNDEMQKLAQVLMPLLSEHSNNISLNEKLFARVKAVYDNRKKEKLNTQQLALLENTYKGFTRSGANLSEENKAKYREITKNQSIASLQYDEKMLKAVNDYQMLITNKDDLKGLPENVITTAAEEAKAAGKEGWIFTLQYPSFGPFLTYADNRELRKKIYMANVTKNTQNNENNTLDLVRTIVNNELYTAQLLGYKSFADFNLEERMAKNSAGVYKLENQLLEAYKPTALKEVEEIRNYARKEQGNDFELMPWDFSYYAQKLKTEKFNINDEMLRPYFELSQVKKGVFELANKLYGITFKENKNIPVYHKDVVAYEVFDKDGKFLSVFYADFHPREGKRQGAWMNGLKGQWIDSKTGVDSRPQVMIVLNFTKPTADTPSLLTYDEVQTFLHEFGHALHGMFSKVQYQSLASPNVYWDFVELPSQIMENFASEPEFLNTFARHYKTGELIPTEMIQRIKDSENFNVAYGCLRQISFGLLDMALYTRTEPLTEDVAEYERKAMAPARIIEPVEGDCMASSFGHIIGGGYQAGYYSYKWAEVLDADAFSVFQEKGIFNKKVAESFRTNILEKGRTEHPMTLYKRFRGGEPTIDALLKRNGIK